MKSRIAVYSPFIGPGGLLRSTGRTKRLAEIDFDLKHPIILDGRHPLVLFFLRFSCVLCRKRNATPVQPMMANLPSERLGFQSPPFTNVGLDYFGPFYVTIRRSSEKRWGFLFTCLTTCAVHVEILHSMDAHTCVMGIERFIARRGMPSVIWSDNGTNFVGAEKDLLACLLNWDAKFIASKLAQNGIKWKFNPPPSPHHGGVWERLVRSFKRTLYAILDNRRLTDEILHTNFCLVEQTLNNRPLTPVSSDANDFVALTPNHFLLGNRSSCLLSLARVDDFNHRKRYTRAQAYANEIWKRWLKKYVPALNRRPKWRTQPTGMLKTGDLVWIVDDDSPRGHYPLARVSSLRYGNDGIARSAEVQTPNGTLSRPVINLMPVLESSLLGPEDVANANAFKREEIHVRSHRLFYSPFRRAVKTSGPRPRGRWFECRQSQKFCPHKILCTVFRLNLIGF